MTTQEFFAKWDGKTIDFDGAYGNQCMDLMHIYVVEVLGISDPKVLAAIDANHVWTTFATITGHEYFEQIANAADNYPKEGDIVLWGTKIGQWGHVSICKSADVNTLTTFDQNWPTGSTCHFVTHPNYTGVLGWLRPKGKVITIPQTLFESLVHSGTLYNEFKEQGFDTVEDIVKAVEAFNETKRDKESEIKSLTYLQGELYEDIAEQMGLAVSLEEQQATIEVSQQETLPTTQSVTQSDLLLNNPVNVTHNLTFIEKLRQLLNEWLK